MARICDRCKKDVIKIAKDTNSSLWLCESCLKEVKKKKKDTASSE